MLTHLRRAPNDEKQIYIYIYITLAVADGQPARREEQRGSDGGVTTSVEQIEIIKMCLYEIDSWLERRQKVPSKRERQTNKRKKINLFI